MLGTVPLLGCTRGSPASRPELTKSGTAKPNQAELSLISQQPMQPGGNADVGPLFVRRAAERTGIDLVHHFPEDAPFELMTDQYSGSGVCIGDVDSDGLPDIYLTNYNRGNRL
jgi:hypothetical protein